MADIADDFVMVDTKKGLKRYRLDNQEVSIDLHRKRPRDEPKYPEKPDKRLRANKKKDDFAIRFNEDWKKWDREQIEREENDRKIVLFILFLFLTFVFIALAYFSTSKKERYTDIVHPPRLLQDNT